MAVTESQETIMVGEEVFGDAIADEDGGLTRRCWRRDEVQFCGPRSSGRGCAARGGGGTGGGSWHR